MISDPLFYFVAVPAVLLAGISKGGFGGGLAMLGVPFMSLVISAPRAAAIMLPILCLMDLFSVWAYRKTWHAVNFKIMVKGALIGIVFGTITFHMLNDGVIKFMVGCVAVSFTLHHWLKRGGSTQSTDPSTLKGMFWGALAGFTSFIAHAGGPPANAYLLPQRMDKTLFVGTLVMVFTAINYGKLIPYWWLGLLPVSNLTMSLILAPLAPIGVIIGVWLHTRISALWFYRLCYLFLFASGLKLLYDGTMHLIG
ncbi:MAG: sulfite exporter TauE/SafE family protein [Rhodospirillales bacterium]|nr:sulfite exporter TauE/SafE family protein [Rhodospirillales bacterium]